MRRLIAHRALKRVNVIRAKIGYKPIEVLPVGDRQRARSCVLANALPGGSVGERIEAGGQIYPHSFSSLLFIQLFDLGLYPVFESRSAFTSEGKRRRMCETRLQTVQRRYAEKKSNAAKEVVNQLRTSEEETFRIRQQLEGALARETKAKGQYEKDITVEREISARLEKRLDDTRRTLNQRITELELESGDHLTPAEADEAEVASRV